MKKEQNIKNLGKFAQKGAIPWNKGQRGSQQHSEITKQKMRGRIPWNKNKKGLQISWCKGTKGIVKPNSGSIKKGDVREKCPSWKGGLPKCLDCGKVLSHTKQKRCRECNTIFYRGEATSNWQGGVSCNPYPIEFNRKLKLKIRTRDNFTCCLCGRTEREELEELNRILSVNHKNFDKSDCREENLNTLCACCNTKINRDREYWTNYFK